MKKKVLNALIEERYMYAFAAAYAAAHEDREAEGKCREAIRAIEEIASAVGLKEDTDYEVYKTTKTVSSAEVTFFAWKAMA